MPEIQEIVLGSRFQAKAWFAERAREDDTWAHQVDIGVLETIIYEWRGKSDPQCI